MYRISAELAVVSTADFFTPIVDNPYDFGRIAATNALSDVYAMGAEPIMAINLLAFPIETLGQDLLQEILCGGAAAASAANVPIAGGHSIDDPEPKYGLAVTGIVHPDKILRNSTARVGDELRLTKPIGGGIATTALKRGLADEKLVARTVDVMTELNREAAEAACACSASAMTDVTGFGLLGHLYELASASGVAARIEADAVPAIEGVTELLVPENPPISGGTRRNREWVEPNVEWSMNVSEEQRWLLCDAMTSGGLLIAAKPGSGAPGSLIGQLEPGDAGRISVV